MTEFGITGLLIALATFLVSYKGFKDHLYFDAYSFRVDSILHGRQYYRLLTSGLLHTGWVHLLFNTITFYCFSSAVEAEVGYGNFLLLYVISLVGGNLFSLWIHRHQDDYTAVGASGAISGLVFACIALYPGIEVGLVGIFMPGWLYGCLYVLLSAYGTVAQRDNIGHDAHLGGGIIGLLTVVALKPALLLTNYLTIAAILAPAVAFFILVLKKPQVFVVRSFFGNGPAYQTVDDKYHTRQRQQEQDLDMLLDKINHKGLENLSEREKKQLEKLSR